MYPWVASCLHRNWNRVLNWPIVPEQVNKFAAFCGTVTFITVFIRALILTTVMGALSSTVNAIPLSVPSGLGCMLDDQR